MKRVYYIYILVIAENETETVLIGIFKATAFLGQKEKKLFAFGYAYTTHY